MFKRIHQFFRNHYYRRYHGVYRHAKQLFVFDLALLALGGIMLGAGIFFWLWKPDITNLIDVSISLGDTRIKSGDIVRLTVDYTNRSKYQLDDATLALHLPDGFTVDRTKTPETIFTKDSLFHIQTIPPGAKGQVEVDGIFWSNVGSGDRIEAALTYTRHDTGSREQKNAAYFVTLPGSVLQTNLAVATSTFPNQAVPFSLSVRNTAPEPVQGIAILNSDKNISLDNNTSTFSLAPNEQKIITGRAVLPATLHNFTLAVTPQVLINNHALTQGTASQDIIILTPGLFARVRFPSNPTYIEPGMQLPVELTWSNDGSVPLSNLVLRLNFNPQIVDLTATAKANNAKVDGTSLIFDHTSRTELNGDKGGETFTATLQLLPRFGVDDAKITQFEVLPVLEASAATVYNETFIASGTSAASPLTTELTLGASARYYTPEGDQLGRGPLPPIVGETTKYWIFVHVINTTNNVSDARFTTTLPDGVTFTGRQSVTIGPSIAYNDTTRTVTWNYSSLPAHSQTGLYFEVAVTPTPEQIGQTLPLTKAITFTATDAVTHKAYALSQPGVTNVLANDDIGQKKGALVAGQ